MNKYKILKLIGDGTYGTVYKGLNTETNSYVAIKILKKNFSNFNDCLKCIYRTFTRIVRIYVFIGYMMEHKYNSLKYTFFRF